MAGFLDSLKARCEVVELDGGRDWRHGADVIGAEENKVKWFIDDSSGFEAAWKEAVGDRQGGSSYARSIAGQS